MLQIHFLYNGELSVESDLDFSSAILIVATILSPTTVKNFRSINVMILNNKM